MVNWKREHLPTLPYFIIKLVIINCTLSILYVRGALFLEVGKKLTKDHPLVGFKIE